MVVVVAAHSSHTPVGLNPAKKMGLNCEKRFSINRQNSDLNSDILIPIVVSICIGTNRFEARRSFYHTLFAFHH